MNTTMNDLGAALGNLQQQIGDDQYTHLNPEWLVADEDGQDRGSDYWLTDEAKAKIKEIAESASAIVNGKPYGIRTAIEVMPTDNPRVFRIIAGEHRWRGALEAKLDLVPVIIKRGATEQEASIDRLVENVVRNPLGIMQLAIALQKRLDQGITKPDLLKLVGGKSAAWLSKYLSPLKMGHDIQELAKAGRFTSIEDMKAIDSLKNDVRDKALDKIHKGEDPKLVVQKFCNRVKQNQPEKKEPQEKNTEYPIKIELSESMAKRLLEKCGIGGEFDSPGQVRDAIFDVLWSEQS